MALHAFKRRLPRLELIMAACKLSVVMFQGLDPWAIGVFLERQMPLTSFDKDPVQWEPGWHLLN